jgi:hypothetical protein
MKRLASTLWALAATSLLLGAAALGAACDIDGVTPNCSADGGDCLTGAGDAYPIPDDAGSVE